jgi:uncharacterized protein (DUF2062 family)
VVPFEWDWAHWIDSFEALGRWMVSLGPPLAVGLLALALTLAALGYCLVQAGWRIHVLLAWRRRQKSREARAK